DFIPRGGKLLPLYSRVVEAGAPPAIVLPATEGAPRAALREGDVWWSSFLAEGQRATESSTSRCSAVLPGDGMSTCMLMNAWLHASLDSLFAPQLLGYLRSYFAVP
ncbi:unnamed protein product, partial [Closterium sp. NIES-54]